MADEKSTKNRMPTGGELLGRVVDMLNMMEIYEDDSWKWREETARRYLKGKTLDNSEQRVNEETQEAIQRRFVDAMVPEGGMPKIIKLFVKSPREFLYMQTKRVCDFWTRVANTLNGQQHRPHDVSLAYYGPVRLATISLAFRWGAYQGIRQTFAKQAESDEPIPEPDFSPWFLEPAAFEKVLDLHRECSITELAERVGVGRRTLYNWKRGETVPAPSKVTWLAQAIAPQTELDEAQLVAKLRLALLVSQVHQNLRELIGNERMEELRDIFWVVSWVTANYVEAGTGEDIESDFRRLQCLHMYGTRSEPGLEVAWDVFRALASQDETLWTGRVAIDLIGLQDWRGRLLHWDRVAFEVDTLRGHHEWPAEERLTGGLLDEVDGGEPVRRRIVANEYFPPFFKESPSGRRFDRLPELLAPMTRETPELDDKTASYFQAAREYVGSMSFLSVSHQETALEHIDRALDAVPDHPILLNERGVMLFRIGQYEQDEETLRDAFHTLHKADCRSHEWPIPRLNMADMLGYAGAFEQSEVYLTRIEGALDDYYRFHGIRGVNFFWAGDFQRAAESLERCRELAPGYGETHVLLAQSYEELGDHDRAQRYRRNARELLGIDDFDELDDPSQREISLAPPHTT